MGKNESINQEEVKIPEIRIMPMNSSEFGNKDVKDIQREFFIEDLLHRENCEYYYKQQGLSSKNNSLLLFQMAGCIIASARLNEVIKKEPEEGYKGSINLYPESIKVFNPIYLEDIKRIYPDFKGFSQVKQYIDIKNLDEILKLIELKSEEYELTELVQQNVDIVTEELAKQLSLEALLERINNDIILKTESKTEIFTYYRNPYLKELVKRIADGKCQLCGEEAPFIDKKGNHYLEIHHVDRLADGGKDELGNVVALCPNCHRRVHILEDKKDKENLIKVAECILNKFN